MNRLLRISKRPFIAMAVVLSPAALIWIFVFVQRGYRSDLILAALIPFGLYAAIMFTICSKQVTVSEDGIAVRSYFLWRRFIAFADIRDWHEQILAEPDHPVSIVIHYRDGQEDRTLTILLKPYHKDDVVWLRATIQSKRVQCICQRFIELNDSGMDMEGIMRTMRGEGRNQMDMNTALTRALHMSSREADTIIMNSEAWKDRRETTIQARRAFTKTMLKVARECKMESKSQEEKPRDSGAVK